MNLPNKLTILRILLVPLMVICSYLQIKGKLFGVPIRNILCLIIFAIASITDHLDGKIARKNGQVTNFGKFLDPIADKILVASALIYLSSTNIIPYWIVVIVIFREFIISGYRLVVVEQGKKVISASKLGKIKTATTMLAIIFGFLTTEPYFAFFKRINMKPFDLFCNALMSAFLTIAIIYTIISAIDYMKDWKKYLQVK